MKISICLALLACILSCEPGLAQRPDWRLKFVPLDPWRTVGGQTNYVKTQGVEFCGKIVDVVRGGVRIEGEWGRLGTVYYPRNGWSSFAPQPEYNDFFVANFPYPMFIGEIIPSDKHFMAWPADDYSYQTTGGDSRTIRKLDYGTPSGPDPVLLAAAQKQIQEAKQKQREIELRRMEELEHDATNGDSSAQYGLAIYYLHGIGCETNEVAGIFWLLKATAQGNAQASNDLQEIESPSTNSASVQR